MGQMIDLALRLMAEQRQREKDDLYASLAVSGEERAQRGEALEIEAARAMAQQRSSGTEIDAARAGETGRHNFASELASLLSDRAALLSQRTSVLNNFSWKDQATMDLIAGHLGNAMGTPTALYDQVKQISGVEDWIKSNPSAQHFVMALASVPAEKRAGFVQEYIRKMGGNTDPIDEALRDIAIRIAQHERAGMPQPTPEEPDLPTSSFGKGGPAPATYGGYFTGSDGKTTIVPTSLQLAGGDPRIEQAMLADRPNLERINQEGRGRAISPGDALEELMQERGDVLASLSQQRQTIPQTPEQWQDYFNNYFTGRPDELDIIHSKLDMYRKSPAELYNIVGLYAQQAANSLGNQSGGKLRTEPAYQGLRAALRDHRVLGIGPRYPGVAFSQVPETGW